MQKLPSPSHGAKAERLDALTGLRFVAAFAIVLHHSRNILPGVIPPGWPLDHGVSFFFVLSGFILTHVYPSLQDRTAVAQFFVARIARIWPAHVVAMLLVIAVFGVSFVAQSGTLPTIANVLLLHAWVPLPKYFFGYNAPSWSICSVSTCCSRC
jgi:peptidoglycan/LPS O-acetylase OafA/YrhL